MVIIWMGHDPVNHVGTHPFARFKHDVLYHVVDKTLVPHASWVLDAHWPQVNHAILGLGSATQAAIQCFLDQFMSPGFNTTGEPSE